MSTSLAIGLAGIGIAAALTSDRLRGAGDTHRKRLEVELSIVRDRADQSLHGPCAVRRRDLQRGIQALARADAHVEWVGDMSSEVEVAYDALMIAQREWQSDCDP